MPHPGHGRDIDELDDTELEEKYGGDQMAQYGGKPPSYYENLGIIEDNVFIPDPVEDPDPILPIVSPSIPTVLPSLPSISNVGAVPFTGTVSNIPGGFQPLPQTAGGRKKLYQLSKFHGGLNKKSSPRDISDMECQEAVNVTVSSIGRIKLLGDCLNENNVLKEFAAITAADLPGYGLFEFTAPADPSGAVTGDQVILLTADGDQVDALCDKDNDEGEDTTAGWIDMAGTDSGAIAQVYYAAGNGVYVGDASFTNASKAKIWVYRKDYDSATPANAANLITSEWGGGKPLIDSPAYKAATGGGGASTDGRVAIEFDDGTVSFTATTVAGAATVHVGSSGTGSWNGDYLFYISWLFDGGVETGLTALQTQIAAAATGGKTFANEQLSFNFSVEDNNSSRNHIGGDSRIDGARIYFKKVGDTERFLLAEVNLVDGIKGALDSTFTPWDEPATDTFDLASNIVFDAPPEVYSYASLNGYYANEVYNESQDILADEAAGPTAFNVRYKTAVVGSGGIVFIGNVKRDGRHMPDSMMFSMPGKPGLFPMYNRFDSPSSDGSPIRVLTAYKDTILQFKENGLYVINVSNPAQFYAQSSFRDCGVSNPCQVFTTSFGVIFANKNGCYIYDGQRVTSLTDGKFDWAIQSYIGSASPAIDQVSNQSTANFPCVGYDPRSQSIIVLKDIGDDSGTTQSTNEGAWVYNMITQSWTEGYNMIVNGNNVRHTNFIITNEGYLSIKSSGDPTLHNFNHDKAVDTGTQAITYHTKDLDFGLPSQTKKLFKVYITYKGTPPSTVNYRIDGSSTVYGFTQTNWAAAAVDDYEIATLVPDDADEAKDWYSMSLFIDGTAGGSGETFEINDISILYRARPIK